MTRFNSCHKMDLKNLRVYMALGDAVKLKTIVLILNHISSSITWSQLSDHIFHCFLIGKIIRTLSETGIMNNVSENNKTCWI